MRRSLPTFVAALTTVGALVVPAGAASATDLGDSSTTTATAAPSTTYAASIGAVEAWAQGHTGAGVGIALIDTGVDPVPGLEDRIAARFDVSGAPNLTDGHGHGTFLAGLMVGGAGPDGAPLGVAPGAHVVSIKVADMHGDTTLDRVLSGLAVARATRGAFNTRVIVLALGGPADDLRDPLEEALQDLWADGFVVVVPSGNQADMVVEPGVSPYLLTVGAVDDAGTPDASDDRVAPWSATGAARAAAGPLTGAPKPEVLAPGVSLVSTRMPGSTADIENPGSRIDGRWFRGSGTSMAAAVAAGAAALLIDADPSLTPDQVKGRLAASGRALPSGGARVLDVPAALGSDAVANVGLPALAVREPEQPTGGWTGTDFTGRSWIGRSWIGRSWIGDEWTGRSWIGRSWIGRSWIDAEWDGRSWIGRSWIGRSWIELEWDGRSWIGRSWIDHEWEGRSWIGRSWIGRSWIGSDWEGRSWIGARWTAGSWLGAGWS
ncbi:MAG: S8 family serine peptidase [Actinobacteria bacterium]|nr:S8 family serine peptidase [Actinomycetota bacterium]